MTFRATTHEQFRIVLRWVKEHPVLARNDNEIEKDGRELKNKLWQKLAEELNELGPPVRAWMAWKRVLTDYKYSLKKKLQRRIANTTQGGTEILASLSELEMEALQVSLLDWDFSDPEKMHLSDTPPVDDMQMQQKSPEDILAGTMDPLQRNEMIGGSQTVNGNVEIVEKALPKTMNGGNASVTLWTNSDDCEIKEELTECAMDENNQNGNDHNMSCDPSLEIVKTEEAEHLTEYQLINAEDLTVNGESRARFDDLKAPTQDPQQGSAQDQPRAMVPETLKPPMPMFAAPSEAAPNLQNIFMSSSVPPATNEYSETMSPMQLPQATQHQHEQMQVEVKQEHIDEASPAHPDSAQQSLKSDVMNSLIAREIDRMAVAQKTRKATQRKAKEKPKVVKETATPQSQKPNKDRVQKVTATDQADRNKRVAPKRPRPRPKDSKQAKKPMTGREFRECLIRLLTDANEMEKRRIAITETKVRNQTEIQNLEITRMNLEIMKLQKEITLLDHGSKILS